ncbi:arrestin domain-containing protein 3-like isoform X1 [Pundamilia nyererei]|uniref:Arrestin domain-containing protein 3-like isoform X1 n=1 Tax=Pundamilia nyererei TaxID=303518 RepID=A0A9Y3VC56_9CICH|nr:PREDICTED: arrestin domain-containing protein 3-like isoform X1 [Pundamilia nyererei]
MSPIKDFNVIYTATNDDDTVSPGDIIVGAVIFRLTKEVKVKSVSLKIKGDAFAQWSDGDTKYFAQRRYFKVKSYVVEKNPKGKVKQPCLAGTVLPQGVNSLFFAFKLPDCDMPSSFQGKNGRISYIMEAKIARSWHWSSDAQKEIKFMSRSSPHTVQMMHPQSGSVSKNMGGRSRGQVQMSATINRGVCSPGETLSVVAKICNSSSKEMRPKFKLQQKIVYSCKKHTNPTFKTLCKMVGDTISPNSEQTVSCKIKIPGDIAPTLHNCDIISVEYYVKVYLDISFAFDPEVTFPLVILPSRLASIWPDEALGQSVGEGGAAKATSYNVHAVPTASGACQYPIPDPPQDDDIKGGNYNQLPQGATSLGLSAPASTVDSMQQPAILQGEPSPLSTSIYQH